MTDRELIHWAQQEGFEAAVVRGEDIPVNPTFRRFCEQNLCGNYGASYACPPDCGTVEEMRERLLSQDRVLVMEKTWEVKSFSDPETVTRAKNGHNGALLRLMGQLRQQGYSCFGAGYNGCPLCSPCRHTLGEACPHPEERIACLSAYCVDVGALAEKCGLPFAWEQGKLYMYAIIAMHQNG